MKICSFDVGIVHLAYCIMENENDKDNELKNKFKIHDLNVVNFDDTTISCCHLKKGKNTQCTKRALWKLKIVENEYHYCSLHKNDHKKLLSEFIAKSTLENDHKKKCEHVTPSLNNCKKKASYDIEDKSYCETHFKGKCNYKKFIQATATQKPMQILTMSLYNILDSKPEILDVDEILIENQPSLINPSMKTIAALLFGYFITRGLLEKEKTKSKILNVRFISPTNKLKIDNESILDQKQDKEQGNKTVKSDKKKNKLKIDNELIPDQEQDNNKIIKSDKKKNKDEYVMTKSMGIKYCKALLEESGEIDFIAKLNVFEKQDKADDACDAFLQGYHYLFSESGEVSENIKKIIKEEFQKMKIKKQKADISHEKIIKIDLDL